MVEVQTNPFPVIRTERLILRQVSHDDVQAVFDMRSDPETMKYIPRPVARNLEDAMSIIRAMELGQQKKESINWAITLAGDNRLLGIIGYPRMDKEHRRGEIGYLLHRGYHRQGIMQEAIVPVIGHGFRNMRFHTIEGIIDPGNIASENLLLKNGFIKEAHFRENLLFEGKWMDSVHYVKYEPDKAS